MAGAHLERMRIVPHAARPHALPPPCPSVRLPTVRCRISDPPSRSWTLDSMAERITVDHEGLLAAFERAGFVPCTMRAAPPVLPTGQATVPCSICLNSVSINEVFAPNPCGHLFCNECWRFCIKVPLIEFYL